MGMLETAEKFFEACETGKGWDGCAEYCTDTASFTRAFRRWKGVSPGKYREGA